MTAGLNNVEFPPCALYTSVNCLLEQRRLYSKKTQQRQKVLGAFLQGEEQRAFERGGGSNGCSYCGDSTPCPLMLANVFTTADSVDGAVVSSTRPGPHKSNVVWGGMLFFSLFLFFGGGGGREGEFHKRLCVTQMKRSQEFAALRPVPADNQAKLQLYASPVRAHAATVAAAAGGNVTHRLATSSPIKKKKNPSVLVFEVCFLFFLKLHTEETGLKLCGWLRDEHVSRMCA